MLRNHLPDLFALDRRNRLQRIEDVAGTPVAILLPLLEFEDQIAMLGILAGRRPYPEFAVA